MFTQHQLSVPIIRVVLKIEIDTPFTFRIIIQRGMQRFIIKIKFNTSI